MCIIFTTRYHTHSPPLKFRYSARFKSQIRIEYSIWGRIKLLYMVRNIFWGRYRLSLFIIPKDFEILFDIFCMCTFQVICRSIMVSPRKLKSSALTKGFPFNSDCGVWLIISHWWLRNIMYFVFLTFSDNLFSSSHFCISFSSLFITCGTDTIYSIWGVLFFVKRAKRASQICITWSE